MTDTDQQLLSDAEVATLLVALAARQRECSRNAEGLRDLIGSGVVGTVHPNTHRENLRRWEEEERKARLLDGRLRQADVALVPYRNAGTSS